MARKNSKIKREVKKTTSISLMPKLMDDSKQYTTFHGYKSLSALVEHLLITEVWNGIIKQSEIA